MDIRNHLSEFLSPEAPDTSVVPQITADTVNTLLQLDGVPPTFGEANIGRAAINIVANRLLAAGATPRYVAASLFIDTDTPIGLINIVADGMQTAAVDAEMDWTARKASFSSDGPRHGIALSVYATGQLAPDYSVSATCLKPGDAIIVTSPVGTFGTGVEAAIRRIAVVDNADGYALLDAISELRRVVPDVHYMTLAEKGIDDAIESLGRKAEIVVKREDIPVDEPVRSLCGMIGLDPLKMACATAVVIVVSDADKDKALEALHRSPYAGRATVIGRVVK